MNATSRLRLTLAIAAGMAMTTITGAAFAQPVSDVYANAGMQPANGIAAGQIEVAQAPLPGIATAYAQFGPAATGLSFERPIVVAAPFVGRGHVDSAGSTLGLTGLTAGN